MAPRLHSCDPTCACFLCLQAGQSRECGLDAGQERLWIALFTHADVWHSISQTVQLTRLGGA